MRQFVSGWGMRKAHLKRTSSLMLRGFTLIEVMVAVVIISVVIMALIQLFATNTHNFSSLGKKGNVNQYLSFFYSPSEYGFKDKEVRLYDLLQEFDIEDNLRRELKSIKLSLMYQELDTIDMGDYSSDTESEPESEEDIENRSNSTMAFEIGKTVLKIEDTSVAIFRIKER